MPKVKPYENELGEVADWFSFEEIAQVEKDSLPEFFNGVYPSKTPTVYKEYRNFMITLYRTNPQVYITATSKFLVLLTL
jgi:SWIRM domain